MAEPHPIAKKTQDDITQKLCDATNPHLKVEGVITSHIVEGAQTKGISKQDAVTYACQGAMNSMVLMEKLLPESATSILKAAADAGNRLGVDQMDMMMWAMEGIARVTPVLKPGDIHAISAAIDSDYHGASEAFNDFCAKAKNR